MYDHEIDLDVPYRAMWSKPSKSRVLLFKGSSPDIRSVKRLLNDLFGVPVQDPKGPTNADAGRPSAVTGR